MSELPRPARIYVGGVIAIGLTLMAVRLPDATFAQPVLFVALLVLSSMTAALKVHLPLTTSGSTMSVSYAVDFASLLLLGPHETMLVAAGSAFSQCHLNSKERNPIHRTLFSVASLVITVQASGLAFHLLGGTGSAMPLTALARPLVGAATVYFLLNTGLVATAIALSTRAPILSTWHNNFLWSAPSYFVGAGSAALAASFVTHAGYWVAPFTFAPLYLTYRTYKVYMGRIDDEQRHVLQTSDLHLATIEALARAIDAKDQTTQMHIRRVQVYATGLANKLEACPEPEIQGIKTGRAAARHRQARRARAHPVEAGTADAGRVPEDPDPPAGRRRDHRRRAVPLSGRAAHHEPPRAVGRQGLSAGARRRGHPARRAHPHHRRLLRRGDDGAAVSQGAELRERDRAAEARGGARARSEAGADVHRDAAVAHRGARPRRAGNGAGRTGARAAGIDRRRPGAGAERQRVREHRARAPRDLRALRDRAVDGHEPRRVRTRWRSSRRSCRRSSRGRAARSSSTSRTATR